MSTSAGEAADALHSLAIHLLRQVRVEDDALGLNAGQLSALSVLVFGGPHTLGKLAAAERVSLPTMTRIGAALTRLGYVRRESIADDRRFALLSATARGKQLLLTGRERRVRRLGLLLNDLTAAEITLCATAAQVLVAALARNVSNGGSSEGQAPTGDRA